MMLESLALEIDKLSVIEENVKALRDAAAPGAHPEPEIAQFILKETSILQKSIVSAHQSIAAVADRIHNNHDVSVIDWDVDATPANRHHNKLEKLEREFDKLSDDLGRYSKQAINAQDLKTFAIVMLNRYQNLEKRFKTFQCWNQTVAESEKYNLLQGGAAGRCGKLSAEIDHKLRGIFNKLKIHDQYVDLQKTIQVVPTKKEMPTGVATFFTKKIDKMNTEVQARAEEYRSKIIHEARQTRLKESWTRFDTKVSAILQKVQAALNPIGSTKRHIKVDTAIHQEIEQRLDHLMGAYNMLRTLTDNMKHLPQQQLDPKSREALDGILFQIHTTYEKIGDTLKHVEQSPLLEKTQKMFEAFGLLMDEHASQQKDREERRRHGYGSIS